MKGQLYDELYAKLSLEERVELYQKQRRDSEKNLFLILLFCVLLCVMGGWLMLTSEYKGDPYRPTMNGIDIGFSMLIAGLFMGAVGITQIRMPDEIPEILLSKAKIKQ